MRKIQCGLLALLGVILVVPASYLKSAQAADKVEIAVIVPLSGPNASVGEMIVNATKLAVEDVNAAGGIKSLGGAKLTPIIADATNDPQGAITTTERVLTQNKVAGGYGLALSPLTTAALPSFVKHHVAVVTSAISDALVTPNNGGYLFQIAPKGSAFGNQEVKFLEFLNDKYKMGITKAAILYVNNPYGIATEKGIEQLAQKAGLEIVLNSAYPESITDASPLVSKIQQSGAQVLFPVSYISDASLLLTALRSAESHVLVIGGGAGFIWPPIGQSLGAKVNGLTSVASWNLDSKNVKGDPKLEGRHRALPEIVRHFHAGAGRRSLRGNLRAGGGHRGGGLRRSGQSARRAGQDSRDRRKRRHDATGRSRVRRQRRQHTGLSGDDPVAGGRAAHRVPGRRRNGHGGEAVASRLLLRRNVL